MLIDLLFWSDLGSLGTPVKSSEQWHFTAIVAVDQMG